VTSGPRTSSNNVRHVSISKPVSSYQGAYSFVLVTSKVALDKCEANVFGF
jgi:hypothetical protein